MVRPIIFITQLYILVVVGLGLATCALTISLPSIEKPIPPTATSTLAEQPTATPNWALFPPPPTISYTVEALYQPFEHGFMVWRGDENCAYVLLVRREKQDVNTADAIIPAEMPGAYPYGYCLKTDPLIDQDVNSPRPPAGLLLPKGVLGVVWAYYKEVEMELGYATATETRYLATIPTINKSLIMSGSPFRTPQMTLPNGHILACGSRGATVGTCRY